MSALKFSAIRRALLAPAILGAALGVLSFEAHAGDPVTGRTLYITTNGAPLGCAAAACHGPDVTQNKNKILRGANAPALIQNAIAQNVGGMGFLSTFVNATDADHIASYIANPNAGNGAPAITLSSASLAFGNQALTTTSAAMTVTVTNSGSAALSLTNIVLGGTNPGEFTRAGTCAAGGSVAVGGSCTITATFSPQVLGARSASVALTHNATGGSSTIALSGTGTQALPAINLSATAINFIAAQLLNTASAPQTLTVSNSGVAALTFSSISLGGTNAGEFTTGGTCAVGTPVAPGANCTVSVIFRPIAAGARSATLSLASNAAASPTTVAVAGNGTTVLAPQVQLSATMLALGNEIVGSPTAARPLTITNVGSAALTINSIASSGADFSYQSACGATVAAGANCVVQVVLTPTAQGARSGTLSINTNAGGSPHVVQLSGVGYPAGTLSTVTLAPSALTFAAQGVNTASAAQTVTLTNNGPVPVKLSNFNFTGANFAEFARSGGTCALNTDVAEQSTCTIAITFTPTATGNRTATLALASTDISGSAAINLSGTATAPAGTAMTAGSTTAVAANGGGSGVTTGTNAGAGGCAVGAPDRIDPILVLLALIALARLMSTSRRRGRGRADADLNPRFNAHSNQRS